MSHSTQIKIKIGGFVPDISVMLEYGSRAPALSYGVEVGRPKTFVNDQALDYVFETLPMHGYHDLIKALYDQAKFVRSVYENEKAVNWLTITIDHFD